MQPTPSGETGPGNTVTAAPAGPPAHAARPPTGPGRIGIVGALAALGIAGIAAAALVPSSPDSAGTATSARSITAAPRIPLSPAEIVELTRRPAEFGPLADPARRAACLTGLGRPATTAVLGARELRVAGRPAVVLVLPAERPGDLIAVAVEPGCGDGVATPIADITVAGAGITPT